MWFAENLIAEIPGPEEPQPKEQRGDEFKDKEKRYVSQV